METALVGNESWPLKGSKEWDGTQRVMWDWGILSLNLCIWKRIKYISGK